MKRCKRMAGASRHLFADDAWIERQAERIMDFFDYALMRRKITKAVYDRQMEELDAWIATEYAKIRELV